MQPSPKIANATPAASLGSAVNGIATTVASGGQSASG